MTLNVHRRRQRKRTLNGRLRITLEGYDVTNRCTRYDGRLRRVMLFDVDPEGRLVVDWHTHEVMQRWHYGRVRARILPHRNRTTFLPRRRYKGEVVPPGVEAAIAERAKYIPFSTPLEPVYPVRRSVK